MPPILTSSIARLRPVFLLPPFAVNSLKTVTSRAIRKNHAEHLSKFYRKRVLWSGSYAILTAGGAPLEVLKQ
ncbi:Transposase IS200 like protein [Calidithermus roseus]|uniref:Transposase IS200 like protein n=1 Tax=Calidithermus roseus TaxID=1644118 RepID=A0A399EX98_9DEIN|nr:Transposase IS200 like protein [Calidithermus roseus]